MQFAPKKPGQLKRAAPTDAAKVFEHLVARFSQAFPGELNAMLFAIRSDRDVLSPLACEAIAAGPAPGAHATTRARASRVGAALRGAHCR